eukprot:scpid57659/ scgid1057/ 
MLQRNGRSSTADRHYDHAHQLRFSCSFLHNAGSRFEDGAVARCDCPQYTRSAASHACAGCGHSHLEHSTLCPTRCLLSRCECTAFSQRGAIADECYQCRHALAHHADRQAVHSTDAVPTTAGIAMNVQTVRAATTAPAHPHTAMALSATTAPVYPHTPVALAATTAPVHPHTPVALASPAWPMTSMHGNDFPPDHCCENDNIVNTETANETREYSLRVAGTGAHHPVELGDTLSAFLPPPLQCRNALECDHPDVTITSRDAEVMAGTDADADAARRSITSRGRAEVGEHGDYGSTPSDTIGWCAESQRTQSSCHTESVNTDIVWRPDVDTHDNGADNGSDDLNPFSYDDNNPPTPVRLLREHSISSNTSTPRRNARRLADNANNAASSAGQPHVDVEIISDDGGIDTECEDSGSEVAAANASAIPSSIQQGSSPPPATCDSESGSEVVPESDTEAMTEAAANSPRFRRRSLHLSLPRLNLAQAQMSSRSDNTLRGLEPDFTNTESVPTAEHYDADQSEQTSTNDTNASEPIANASVAEQSNMPTVACPALTSFHDSQSSVIPRVMDESSSMDSQSSVVPRVMDESSSM